MADLTGLTIGVGITGGIAAYKAAELCRLLIKAGADVHCIMTKAAEQFIGSLTLQSLTTNPVYTDLFSMSQEGEIGHITLADRLDLLVIAPASANTLSKLWHGVSDNPVTTIALATKAPLVLCPSMNVNMWNHPVTQKNIHSLRTHDRVTVVEPDSGYLACGWTGAGRLPDPQTIVWSVARAIGNKPLLGKKIVMTIGATREAWDPARHLSNRSTGKMGMAIANAAWVCGAEVTVIHGACQWGSPPNTKTSSPLTMPAPWKKKAVVSAAEMYAATWELAKDSDMAILVAAVADYKPVHTLPEKLIKGSATITLELERTKDILLSLGELDPESRPLLVGFAAESQDVIQRATSKLAAKRCDVIVANDISKQDSGFEVDTNSGWILDKTGVEYPLCIDSKAAVGAKIVRWLTDNWQRLSSVNT